MLQDGTTVDLVRAQFISVVSYYTDSSAPALRRSHVINMCIEARHSKHLIGGRTFGSSAGAGGSAREEEGHQAHTGPVWQMSMIARVSSGR